MSKAKHTPGPWRAVKVPYDSSAFYIKARNAPDKRSPMVAHIPRSTVQPMEANARLLAAAPELLEALELLSESCARLRAPGYPPSDAENKARAAIVKAIGGAA